MIKAVLFDLDGTLVDSFDAIVISFNGALEAMGEKPRSRKELVKCIGVPHEETLKRLSKDPKKVKVGVKAFGSIRKRVSDKYTREIEGVRDVLLELKRKKIKTGVVTTTAREMTESILRATNLDYLMDVVVTRDDVSTLKPSPEPVLRALELLNLKREGCIMVGDHPNDIMAAKNAGIMAVGMVNVFSAKELKDIGADFVAEKIKDVLEVI
ncbi:MAG: hypothetical protein A7316_03095 [Candidatus Altiarchaeales archaeon WOR_SM1_86-2]|nr:MAG: hypothetical protein A7316_03095 [Candidatus Altiarchaeales archaeon WOR_SM1_86-2]ODS41532.1 MAG: hypothetical protein A7315_05845 [Candidatus Altiarchaeales archaeon WOR_SM1_79]